MKAVAQRATTATAIIIALIVALVCAFAIALASTSQAQAEESGQTVWFTVYQKGDEYNLVIQAEETVDRNQGTKVYQEQKTLDGGYDSSIHSVFLRNESIDHREFKHVSFSGNIKAPQDMSKLFYNLKSVETINLQGLDTSGTTSMACMFQGCHKLKSIDLSPLDTSKVTNMAYMFQECRELKSIDLSPLNTSKVTDMSGMFGLANMGGEAEGCGFTSIDLSPLDTSNVTKMGGMFGGCDSLTSIDLSPLDTSKVTDMEYMFACCSKLSSIDLPSVDTSKVTSVEGMFWECVNLTSLDLSSFGSSEIDSACFMLYDCKRLSAVALRPGSSIAESGLSLLGPSATCESENAAVVSVVKVADKLPNSAYSNLYTTTALKEGFTRLKFTVGTDSPLVSYLNVTVKKPGAPWDPATTFDNPPSVDSAVAKASLAKAKVTVKSRPFSGKTLTPASITVDLNGKTLKKDVDYTIACKGGKNVGTYKVTVTGKGSYTGTKSAEFKIVPKAVAGVKAKGMKKSLRIVWKKPSKIARAQVTGYQVRYSASKSMKGAKVKKVKGFSKASVTFKKLKGGKKYYVQVRAYKIVRGKTYYSSWSAVKSARAGK